MPTPPLSCGVLLYPGFDVLDIAGPIETLNTLSRIDDQNGFSFKDMTFSFLGETMDPLTPCGGTAFTSNQLYSPTHTFDDAPQLDVRLVPGGLGSVPWHDLTDAVKFIRNAYDGDKGEGRTPLLYLISVCTGAGMLVEAGVLDGLPATTNKMAWDSITPLGPRTHWIARARWIDAGRVWTTSRSAPALTE